MLNVVSRTAIILVSWQIFTLMTACNTESKHADDPGTIVPVAIIPRGFNTALIADTGCMTTGLDTHLQSASIWSVSNGVEQSQQVQLDNVRGVNSLSSQYIADSSYGLTASVSCANTTSGCNNNVVITNGGSPLRICRADGSYPKGSIEDIALTTFTALNNLMAFHDSIPGHDAAILPLHLQIFPTIEVKTGSSLYQRKDNLSYYGNFNNQPTVVVLQSSDNGQNILGNINLWESPWIVAHEASHHIFRTYLTDAVSTGGSSSVNLMGKTLDSGTKLSLADSSVSAFDANQQAAYSAVNEGFADLFAFISLGGDSQYVNGFPCISKNRDINSIIFSNGDSKTLTASNVTTLFSQDTSSLGPCDVNYHDPHIIGAIIAHGLYGVFYYASNAQNTPITMAQMALTWATFIPHVVTTNNSATDMLRNMIYAGLLAAADSNKVLNSEQCAIVRSTFAAFADGWIGASGSLTCR